MPVAVEFATITEMFDRLTAKFADERRPVLMEKVEGRYGAISYSELRRKVELFALGLASVGVKRGDHVSIISENRPEWIVADMGMLYLGAVNVPIYPTLTAKQVEFIFNDSGVKAVVVSNQLQLAKVLKILPKVKSLKKVVLMTPGQGASDDRLLSFPQILKEGELFERHNPEYLSRALDLAMRDDLVTIIYTSGTTGVPKGVMLTNDNFVSNIKSAALVIPFGPDDVLLSYLPLCHSFERMAGYYTAMSCGASIAFAESIESVRENLLEVKPTVVTTVPRLFERFSAGIRRQVDSSPPLRRKLFYWAVNVGRQYAHAKKHGSVTGTLKIQHVLANRLVYGKLHAKMGGRLKYFVSGGAPLAREVGEFFEAVNWAAREALPVIFFIQDNKFAISVPVTQQTAGASIFEATKGFKGLERTNVDGTNFMATYDVMVKAVERARKGEGPTLIVADVVRLLPHSSSDDHGKYRAKDDIEKDKAQDPIPKMKHFLIEQGYLTDTEAIQMQEDIKSKIDAAK